MMKILIVFCMAAGISVCPLSAATTATYYVRDANGNVIAEYDENGELKHFNIYGLDLIGRIEPYGEKDIIRKRINGSGYSTVGEYRTLKGALAAIASETDLYTGVEYIEIHNSNEVVSLQVTTDNTTLTGIERDNTSSDIVKNHHPVLSYNGYGEGTYYLTDPDNNVDNVTLEGVDVVVRNPVDFDAQLIIRGNDVVLKDCHIEMQPQSDWCFTYGTYKRRLQLILDNPRTNDLAEGQVKVVLDPDIFEYSKAGDPVNNIDDIRFIQLNKSATSPLEKYLLVDWEVASWNTDGESEFWINLHDIKGDSHVNTVWLYYEKSSGI